MPDAAPSTIDPVTGEPARSPFRPAALGRAGIGGFLMGAANLVPGISGGTMLLAAGVYPLFVEGVSDVTRLRFRLRTLVPLAMIAIGIVLAFALLATLLGRLVVEHRWAMYAVFIGLTLGGVPLLWRMLRPARASAWIGAAAGLAAMIALAFAGSGGGAGGGGGPVAAALFAFVAGLAAAAAMVLPGLSGGYLLLVLGQYVIVVTSIGAFFDALKAADVAAATGPLKILVPFGLGAAVGIAVISNLVRWLLEHRRQATLGTLLGLLVGAVAGLWPFQEGVPPEVGSTFKGDTVIALEPAEDGRPRVGLAADGEAIDPADWPTEVYTPTAGRAAAAAGLLAAGLLASIGIGRIGSAGGER